MSNRRMRRCNSKTIRIYSILKASYKVSNIRIMVDPIRYLYFSLHRKYIELDKSHMARYAKWIEKNT